MNDGKPKSKAFKLKIHTTETNYILHVDIEPKKCTKLSAPIWQLQKDKVGDIGQGANSQPNYQEMQIMYQRNLLHHV